MKVLLVFSSRHGRTAKVVDVASNAISPAPVLINVADRPDPECLRDYEVLLFFTPTYGDEELQDEMEAFLRSLHLDLSGKAFAICELGNYGGYDDFRFGALAILRRRLMELGAVELGTHLSLDSMPRLNWNHLDRWVQHLNGLLRLNEK